MSIGDFEDDNKRADGACNSYYQISYRVGNEEDYGAGNHSEHKQNNKDLASRAHTASLFV